MEHPDVGRERPLRDMDQIAGDKMACQPADTAVEPIRPEPPSEAGRLWSFMMNRGTACEDPQAALFSSSSSLNSSSRETFFSVTLASSRMKSTTLSSKIGAR